MLEYNNVFFSTQHPILQIIKEKYLFSVVNQTMRKFLVHRLKRMINLEEMEKEEYSAVISRISEDEGYAKGQLVLKTGHERLSDIEKSFISQTLARFDIKHNKINTAIEWAEEAIEDATKVDHQNKGACLDTLGHCHKHALREIRNNLMSKGKIKLQGLGKALHHASEACKCFTKSREFRKVDTINDDSKIWIADIARASNGLCGMVEVFLSVVELILLTEDFVKAKDSAARGIFINILRNPEDDSIKKLSGVLEPPELKILSKLWKENYENLFSHLLSSSKSCLVDAVRLMTDAQIQVRDPNLHAMQGKLIFIQSYLMEVQGSTNRRAPGLVIFVPALANHFGLNLTAAFTQPGARLLVEPCTLL